MNVTSAQNDPSLIRQAMQMKPAANPKAVEKANFGQQRKAEVHAAKPGQPGPATPHHAAPATDQASALRTLAAQQAQTPLIQADPRLEHSGAQEIQAPAEGAMHTITVQGLNAAWGTDDPRYDLTGDGTVGVDDLLILLNNGGTMQVPVPPDYQPEQTVDGLLAAWGTSDPVYDLNGDGKVDVDDLLMLLNGNGQPEPAEASAEQTAPPMLTLEGLRGAWGSDDARYDFNQDGVVNERDLETLIQNGGAMPNPESGLSLDDLLAAWGTNNAKYDFNGNGQVDIQDLIALLSNSEEE